MRKIIQIILVAATLLGCSKRETSGKIVKNLNGSVYFLIRHSSTNSSGIVDIELWQKEGTKNQYTPSLTGNDMIRIM